MKSKATAPNIRKVRQSAGLNQSMFWGRIGVTQSGGSRYETGRSMPKPVKILFDMAYTMNKGDAKKTLGAIRGE